jgi:hypothetical protein
MSNIRRSDEPGETVLLMTATVEPPQDAQALKRVDVALRVNDYRACIRENMRQLSAGTFDRLVFVDNSGFGTESFNDLLEGYDKADRVEFYSYSGNEAVQTRSRLYGECRLIEHALANTKTFSAANIKRFWKITGRYKVRNMHAIMAGIPSGYDLYVHCRRIPSKFVDFGFVAFDMARAKSVLNAILTGGRQDYLDEQDLYQMIEGPVFNGFAVDRRLPAVPDFSGYRGYDNASYDNLLYRGKFLLRSFVHRVFPRVWI